MSSSSTIKALLEDARRRFMRLAREDGADDTPVEVVIARGVTREVFDTMDEDMLYGLVVELRDDGTLVLVEVLTKEYSQAQFEIATAAENYVDANMAHGLVVDNDWQDGVAGGGSNNRRPSVAILEEMPGGLVPLVIFIVQVEGQSGSFSDMIRRASFHFNTILDLKRVVGVQFFRPHEDPGMLQVPAVAVAFERGAEPPADDAGGQRVRVVMARSFGNWPLHGKTIETLVDPPPNVPLESYADAARFHKEWFRCELHMDKVLGDLRALERGHQSHTLPAPMVVPMPPEYSALALPLFKIFVGAMRGWFLDKLARG